MKSNKILLALFCLGIFQFAQSQTMELTFSDQPFEFGKKSDRASKYEFTDDQTIYGLMYIEQTLDEIGLTNSDEYLDYKQTKADYEVSYFVTLSHLHSSAYEIDGKTYIYMDILPAPEHCKDAYSDDWLTIFKAIPDGKSMQFKINAGAKQLKAKIKITRAGNKSIEDLKANAKLAKEVYKKRRDKEEDRLADQKAMDHELPEKLFKYPIAFSDPELNSLEKINALVKASNYYSKIEDVSHVAYHWANTADINRDWHVMTNKYGQPVSKTTPILHIVYQRKSGWCYYGKIYFKRAYEGGGKYGSIYLERYVQAGDKRFSCDKLK
jgi:hypothetical protein